MTTRRSYFVTGTDTGVGKTLVSCGLLHAAALAGHSSLGMKPLAAGAEMTEAGMRNEDAVQLLAASSIKLGYEQINPVCLPDPVSPHIAAALSRRKVSVERLSGFCRGILMQRANLTLTEGAGGWRVPINEHEYMSDLALALKLPVILVVGMRLGCLNQAILSAEAIARDGLELAGWVANRLDPAMSCYEQNRATLERILHAPLLADLPYLESPQPDAVAPQFALERLLAG